MMRFTAGFLILFSFALQPASAGDWRQILGPNRDGIAAQDEKLSFDWGAAGPKPLWQHPAGTGFSGAAMRDGKVFVIHRQGAQEIAECLQLASGKSVWKKTFPASYVPSISYDDGPRCVPTVLADRVVIYSADGVLRCLKIADGALIWEVATHKKYQAQAGYFGAGSSPLVVGSRVIVNVGGDRQDAGVVAFSLENGDELWKQTDTQASYASPISVTLGETPVVLATTRLELVGLAVETGAVQFRVPFGKRGPTVNAANPIVVDGRIFLTASYGIGALYGRLHAGGIETIWESDDLLSSQYTTPIANGKHLYGVHGRQDGGIPELRCLDPATKKVAWTKPLDSYATLIQASGKLLVITVGGELIVVEPNASAYREVRRAKIAEPTPQASALPALSSGILIVRDAEKFYAYDLRP